MFPWIIIILIFLFLLLIISFCLFCFVFYVPKRKMTDLEKIDLPHGKIYEPFYNDMRQWVIQARNTPHEVFTIQSFDNLPLYANYYEFKPGAPVEIMFHGYRGNAERDLSGGINRCFQLGHSAFIVDQRCAGRSGGNVITFGVREHLDCLAWINFAVSHFGSDCKLILTGISMGASTVLMAAGSDLPENVIGVLADCGFHSAKDVIISVARRMGLPANILYPFVRFGAKFFGHFNLEENPPVDAIKRCNIPVLFFHGEDDDYVPSYMSKIVFDACNSRKKLIYIPGAGHGLSYPVAPDRYINEIKNFFT